MNFFYTNKTVGQKLLAIVLAIAVAVPSVFAFIPPPTAQATVSGCISGYATAAATSITMQAQAAIMGVPIGANGQISSQMISAGNGLQNFFKDCIEHGLALMIGKMLLTQMTNQIVSYINSGFHGSAAFVGDPGKMFQNIGDQVVAGALAGINNGIGVNICSPFKAQLLAGLAANFGINLNVSGTGGGGDVSQSQSSSGSSNICATANAESDPSNFQDWGSFLATAMNDQSNPYGAFLSSVNSIENQIVDQVNTVSSQLNWGSGFLSQQDCTHTEYPSHADPVTYKYVKPGGNGVSVSATVGSGTKAPANASAGSTVIGRDSLGNDISSDPASDSCTITTPGKTIADTLQNQLNVPADQLGVADDLDKIFNALFNELLKTGLGALGLGAGGIASAGGGGGGVSSGVWAQIAAEAQASSTAETAISQAEENTTTTQLQNVGTQTINQTPGTTGGSTNVTQGKMVTASPTARPTYDAANLTDGNTAMGGESGHGGTWSGAITSPSSQKGSFVIDLGQQTDNLFKIVIYPHNISSGDGWDLGPGVSNVPATFKVVVSDQNNSVVWDSALAGIPVMPTIAGNPYTLILPQAVSGRYVTIQGVTVGSLQLAEVQVFEDNGPTITMNGQPSIIGSVGQPLSTYDAGATAVDATGSSTPITVSYSSGTSIVDPGTTLANGQQYTITYTATDPYGVVSSASRTVEAISGASAATSATPSAPYAQ